MLRSILLAPCLLTCLACATPFPVESLEEGMTTEAVRKEFGAPEAIMKAAAVREAFGESKAIETESGGVNLSWKYLDETRNWRNFVSFLLPIVLISIPICAAIPYEPWDCAYVTRSPVLLHFDGEKLARWEVIKPSYRFYSQNWVGMDMQHHMMGHTHHHPGC